MTLDNKIAEYIKLAQNTKLDDIYEDQEKYRNRDIYQKPLFQGYNQKDEKPRYQQQQPKVQPIDLNFPEVRPEHIRTRQLNEEELQKLDEKDKKEREQRSEYYYEGYNNQLRDPLETVNIRNTNKHLPEEYQKTVLKYYEHLRTKAAEFYKVYQEANSYAEITPTIDYSQPYANIIKQIPQYLIDSVKVKIGELFGIGKSTRRSSYWRDESAKRLIQNVMQGINIFNITPLNIEEKIRQMRQMYKDMDKILIEFAKREKLLSYLPEKLTKAVNEVLKNKEGKEFLKFMDEHFQGDKKEFVEYAIKEAIGKSSFSFHDLSNFKTYKSQYEKLTEVPGKGVVRYLHSNTMQNIDRQLTLEIKDRIFAKLAALNKEREYSDGDINHIIRYLSATYKIDLKSILQFVSEMIKKSVEEDKEIGLMERQYEEKGSTSEITNYDLKMNLFFQKFQQNLGKLAGDSNYEISSWASEIANQLITNNSSKYDLKALSQFTTQDLENAVNKFIGGIIIKTLPNFNDHSSVQFPNFKPLAKIVSQAGKFSTDAFLRLFMSKFPMVPRDFALHLIRTIMKGGQNSTASATIASFENFNTQTFSFKGNINQIPMNFLLELLKKSGKSNPDTFTKVYINYFGSISSTVSKVSTDLARDITLKEPDIIDILITAVRSPQTVEQDLKNLNDFISFIHNNAAGLNKKDVIGILKSKNFQAFSKVSIVKKLIEAYSEIKSKGGVNGISKKYGMVIKELSKRNYISKDFYKNIRYISSIFQSSQEVSPATDNYKQVIYATNSIETDMEIIEMSDTFKDLLKDYKPKDKNLFKLDFDVSDNLRFRVLQDRDPRILRVGVETNCCQRVGGVGESAAKDSFVNPLASVVILEWKDDDGSWKLLAQSYFHYVPADNSYILDNVETNRQNVADSGVDLEVAYSYLAYEMKHKYNVKYLVAGTGYSKIRASAFNKHSMPEDPRSFSSSKEYGYRGTPYTDFDEANSIDLLSPQFDLQKGVEKMTGKPFEMKPFEEPSKETSKKAFEIGLRRIIFGMSSPSYIVAL